MTDCGDVQVLRNTQCKHEKINETRRFLMLVAGSFGCISVSLSFGFNIFSGDMQKKFNFTQADMSTISTVGVVFAYFGMPYAFVYDYFGLQPVLILGIILITLGALLMGLTFSGIITPTVLNLCIFNAIYNFASGLYDLTCVVTSLGLFPANRGAVVAVMKTYIGLGSAIIGAIQLAFFEGQPANYFYFLMVLGFVIGLFNLVVLRQAPYVLSVREQNTLPEEEISRRLATKYTYLSQKPPSMRFAVAILGVVLLIVLIPLQSLVVAHQGLGSVYRIPFSVAIIIIWLSLFIAALPFKFLNRDWKFWKKEKRPDSNTSLPEEDLPVCSGAGDIAKSEFDYIMPQYQTTFWQSLCTLKFWAIFWSLFSTLGPGLVIITNSRFFFNALAGEEINDSFNTVLTVLNGVGSALGRLVMSYYETWLQKRKPENRIPITLTFFLPTFFVFLMQVLLLTINKKELLSISYLIGALANGVTAIVTVISINTMYAKNQGLHYYYCFLATALSYVLLNRILYGEWYTKEAKKYGGNVCLKRECVQLPLFVMLGLNLSAFVSNAYVHLMYSKMIRKEFAEKRRLREQQEKQEGDCSVCL